MKRIISIFLAVALVLSLFVVSANAKTDKLSEQLKEQLKIAEPDMILEVSVWFEYPKCPEPDFQPEDYGDDLGSTQLYLHDYRAYKSAYYTAHNQELAEQVKDEIDMEIVYISKYVQNAQLKVKAKDIEALAALDCVDEILMTENYSAEPDTQSGLFESRYYDFLSTFDGDKEYIYRELYYHKDESGETDWALVEASAGTSIDMNISMSIDKRIITYNLDAHFFKFNYGIYDVVKDRFIDLYDIKDTPEIYPDLCDTLQVLRIGRPIGDADNDKELTILDATCIQRDLAELETIDDETDRYWIDVMSMGNRFSDYDEDGDITILDATAIQRNLAGLTTET